MSRPSMPTNWVFAPSRAAATATLAGAPPAYCRNARGVSAEAGGCASRSIKISPKQTMAPIPDSASLRCGGRRTRTDQSVENDVAVAQQRQDEAGLHADVVGQHALQVRHHGTADDGHDQQAGPLVGQR